MMNALPSSQQGSRGPIRALLAMLFLVLGMLPARAGTFAGGPTDDVAGLPVVADTAGVTFVGDVSELRSLALSVQGQGRIAVATLPRGGLVITFVGNYRIDLDRAALARSHVAVLFRSGAAFDGGSAVLDIGDSSSSFLDAGRIPLPLGRLAAVPRLLGDVLSLDVAGPTGHRAHVAANLGTDRVTLFQRMR
jgi:hypothetical protein